MTFKRTIISALGPVRYQDDFGVWMKVWFEELDGPVPFCATPFDCEVHGRELWIRAMAGEYGPVEVLPKPDLPVGAVKLLRLPNGTTVLDNSAFCCTPTEDNGPIKWRRQ